MNVQIQTETCLLPCFMTLAFYATYALSFTENWKNSLVWTNSKNWKISLVLSFYQWW